MFARGHADLATPLRLPRGFPPAPPPRPGVFCTCGSPGNPARLLGCWGGAEEGEIWGLNGKLAVLTYFPNRGRRGGGNIGEGGGGQASNGDRSSWHPLGKAHQRNMPLPPGMPLLRGQLSTQKSPSFLGSPFLFSSLWGGGVFSLPLLPQGFFMGGEKKRSPAFRLKVLFPPVKQTPLFSFPTWQMGDGTGMCALGLSCRAVVREKAGPEELAAPSLPTREVAPFLLQRPLCLSACLGGGEKGGAGSHPGVMEPGRWKPPELEGLLCLPPLQGAPKAPLRLFGAQLGDGGAMEDALQIGSPAWREEGGLQLPWPPRGLQDNWIPWASDLQKEMKWGGGGGEGFSPQRKEGKKNGRFQHSREGLLNPSPLQLRQRGCPLIGQNKGAHGWGCTPADIGGGDSSRAATALHHFWAGAKETKGSLEGLFKNGEAGVGPS